MKGTFRLFVLLLFIGLQSFAGDERAGYINYTHTSGNTYHFKIFTYTDPTNLGADRCEETIIFSDISSGSPFYLTCNRTNTTPGVDLVSLNFANCGNGNALGEGLMQVYPFTRNCLTATNYGGVKLNIYEGDYTFSGNGTYIMGMADPNLPPDILNVGGGNSQNIAFALMDTLRTTSFSPFNNSPITSTTLVDSVYRGQTFNYNLNLTDVDDDSLSYSFISFITGDTSGSFYNAGSYIPVGMVINAVTGNLSWPTTATTQYGLYDIDILVKEYRRDLSGSVIEVGSEVFSIQIDVICDPALGINKVAAGGSQITVYPNPANHQSVINISLSHSQQVLLELYDLQGNLVKRITKGKVTEKQTLYEASLTDVTAGTYFYRLITEDGICEKKLVVIK